MFAHGAPSWLLLGPTRTAATVVTRAGDPLGMNPEPLAVYPKVLEVAPSDTLVAYTDGVFETSKGRKAFLEKAAAFTFSDPSRLFDEIQAAALEASHANELPDDFTLAILHWNPAAPRS